MCDFSFEDGPFEQEYRGVIGNGATIQIGSGSVLTKFGGNVRGHGNSVQIEENVRLSCLELNIDGNENRITISAGAHIENGIMNVRGDTRIGNFRGNNNVLCIGASSSFRDTGFDVKGSDNSLVIGARVYVLESAKILLHGYGCSIKVGDLTSMQSAVISASEIDTCISLGRDNMYAGMVVMATGDSHPMFDPATLRRINQTGNITVGDHVWLSGSVRLMKGAAIGDNCVVGFDSFVSGPMVDESGALVKNALIYGSPAKIRATGTAWNREMIYELDGEEAFARKYPDACAQSKCHRGHLLVHKAQQLALSDAMQDAQAAYFESINAYREAISLKPDYAYAYSALGLAHLHLAQIQLEFLTREAAMKQLLAAITNFEQALIYEPKHEDSIACLALSEEFRRVLDSSSGGRSHLLYSAAVAYKQLGLIRLRLGDLEIARKLLQGSLERFDEFTAQTPEATIPPNYTSELRAALDHPELRCLAAGCR